MQEWEKHLQHERVSRDALVKCGNPAPSEPDPEGGLIPVQAHTFKGDIYWAYLEERGHNNAIYERCKCKNKKN